MSLRRLNHGKEEGSGRIEDCMFAFIRLFRVGKRVLIEWKLFIFGVMTEKVRAEHRNEQEINSTPNRR